MDLIRIATRKSPLALWQANEVARRLQHLHPKLRVELVTMTTRGDMILDSPLNKVGGKGLFVKELEQGLLDGRADIAVHSMKDVPWDFPQGLHLPVIMHREDPSDAFVSNDYDDLAAMPAGARVGTSSLRRQAQVSARFPDLTILPLRGNVGTRLQKLDAGEFQAIILASAGLKRLGLANRIRNTLAYADSLPAIGQGAIGIECRQGDEDTERLIMPLRDPDTEICVRAERALNYRLHGGCQVPVAGYAVLERPGHLWLRGLVGDPSGDPLIVGEIRGSVEQADELGGRLADDLLGRGADKILATFSADIANTNRINRP